MAAVSQNLPPEANDATRYVGRIPVRNLWLLMLYASHLFQEVGNAKTAVEDNPDDIPNRVAEILCHKVEWRIRRNLSYGYRHRHEVLNRVRGRIDLLGTESKQLLQQGKVACHYDEFTVNTTRNRYVRAALEKLSKETNANKKLSHRCRSLAKGLMQMGVSGRQPNHNEVSINRFGRHDTHDQPMVAAAHLAFNLALPTEEEGARLLSKPDREIKWIRKLFEKAIAEFYNVVLSEQGWHVTDGKTYHWPVESKSAGIDKILPPMRADIVLEHRESKRRIIIDAKFNEILTGGWYREESLRSGYVYQIYAYLRSQEGSDDTYANNAEGILLHPAVGKPVDETVTIQNHKIRFVTVDLSASARQIREQLIRIV